MAAIDKFTRTTESCGGKGTAWTLSQEERALVAFNCSTCALEIAADAWEREQGSCLLKEGADVKQLQERAT